MWSSGLTAIAAVATTVGVLLILPQLRAAQRQRHRQFEDLYIQRYWSIIDRMSIECDWSKFKVGGSGKLLPGDEAAIRAYLWLCEDQLDMRRLGWVTDETWNLWCAGMSSALSSSLFNEIWGRIKDEDPAACKQLRAFEESSFSNTYDPIEIVRWARWFRGLDGLFDSIGRRPSKTRLSIS